MARRRMFIQRKRIGGPRRSRVRLGPWPFLFFLVTAMLVGACALIINVRLEDRIIAYYAKLRP